MSASSDVDAGPSVRRPALRSDAHGLSAGDPLDFAPALLRLQQHAPAPLPRALLWLLLGLLACLIFWVTVGRLDIVAVAHGKLVAESYLQIVQPAEAGRVEAILVREGQSVEADATLIRLDTRLSDAELRGRDNDFRLRELQLRRIDAELSGGTLERRGDDPPLLFSQVQAQSRARRQAYEDSLATERAALARAQQELLSAIEVEAKLRQTAPIVAELETAWTELAKQGFAAPILVSEKVRARIDSDQALKAQTAMTESLRASVAQSERRLAQLASVWRQELLDERVAAQSEWLKLEAALAQQRTRHAMLELKAPQAGIVQELSTHTVGSVVTPGAVLVTLVPAAQPLLAEVWVSNRDVGFVREGQRVRLKLTAFQFQKYGLVEGVVRRLSPDASDRERSGRPQAPDEAANNSAAPLRFRALIEMASPVFEANGVRYPLSPGMEVSAEVHLGQRTVWEYLTSPLRRAFHDAGRER